MSATHQIIGRHEWIALPELGVTDLRAKIDTGAMTSSLHATDISCFERDQESWVHFTAQLETRQLRCEARLINTRQIRSSNGQRQTRYIIRTRMALGNQIWPVEFSLASRRAMRYRALLGCTALVDGRFFVDPAQSYLQDRPQGIDEHVTRFLKETK